MKKNTISTTILVIALFAGVFSQAQSKKWTLLECVEYAIKNNISIQQTDLENQTAAVEKIAAIGNFLPTVNADASHSWNVGLNQNITTGLLQNQNIQFTSARLNSNVSLYNGLQNQNRLRRANLSIIAAQYQLSKIKDDVSLNVANAFLQILFNKENIKVQKEQVAITKKQLQRSEELVNSGVAPRGDLLDIKATLATNNQSLVIAENALTISKLSLAQLLQLDDFQEFDIVENGDDVSESAVMLQSPAAIFEKAKEVRVELKIAKTNVDIAERDIKIAKGAYQPSLQGFYSFSTRAGSSEQFVGRILDSTNPNVIIGTVEGTNQNVLQPNFVPVFGKAAPVFDQFNTNKGHSYGLQLNVPILNGLTVRNNVARSKIALARSKISYSQQELDLERNVYTAFTDANGAINAYESAVVALSARSEAYNYAKEKYTVGLMNAFDLNQSQTLFVNAQSEVLRTKYDYIFRVKVIEFYFGIPITQKQ